MPGLVMGLSALAFAASLAAQALPKLPDSLPLERSADSPGQVSFNHVTHVDDAKPDCTVCHSKLFSILKERGAARTPITHAVMDKGGKCGFCHDGKKAFSLEECTNCHQGE
jgi:c(7)-type cytochrome triheme protein